MEEGVKIYIAEMENLLDVIEEVIPIGIGNPNWERVWDKHNTQYPNKEQTAESQRRKFLEMPVRKCQQVILIVRLTFIQRNAFKGRL